MTTSSKDVRRSRVKRVTTEQSHARQAPAHVQLADTVLSNPGPPAITREPTVRPVDLDEGSPNDAESGDVAFELGVLLYERGHHDPAEAAWRRAVRHRHARAATRLGMALERRGDVDRASEAYRAAERWGDAVGAERAAALRRPDLPSAGSRSSEEPESE